MTPLLRPSRSLLLTELKKVSSLRPGSRSSRLRTSRESVEAYLVTTEGQVPTDKIIPHSHIVLTRHYPPSIEVTNLVGNSVTIPVNYCCRSNLRCYRYRQAQPVSTCLPSPTPPTNVDNNVYTLVWSNYMLVSSSQRDLIVPKASPANRSTFKIAKTEVSSVLTSSCWKSDTRPQASLSLLLTSPVVLQLPEPVRLATVSSMRLNSPIPVQDTPTRQPFPSPVTEPGAQAVRPGR